MPSTPRKRTKAILAAGLAVASVAAAIGVTGCRSSDITANRSGDAVVFPTVWGNNLLDQRVQFPDDIKGQPTLVYVAFFQRQQTDVNTWLDQMEAVEKAIPGVRVIETPVISGMKWGWMAGYIDNAMRSGIKEDPARARTISLFTDTKAFREALGLPSNDRIYAILTDSDARVISVQDGPYSPDKLEAITEALASESSPAG